MYKDEAAKLVMYLTTVRMYTDKQPLGCGWRLEKRDSGSHRKDRHFSNAPVGIAVGGCGIRAYSVCHGKGGQVGGMVGSSSP